MNTQIPKNVRQIGEIHSEHKIYMEDYVVTFFKQLCKKNEKLKTVILYGRKENRGDQTYHYIYAAALEADGQAAAEQYFQECSIVGWALIGESADESELSQYKNMDNSDNMLLYFLNPDTLEDRFCFIRNHVITDLSGYYIYYDKNDIMQNFMIEWYQANTVASEKMVRDRAAKNFRHMSNGRQEEYQHKKIISLLYVASLMLTMLCCIAGITMINQYDKMKNMEKAIEHLAMALEEQKLPDTTQTAGQNVLEAAAGGSAVQETNTSMEIQASAEKTDTEEKTPDIKEEDGKSAESGTAGQKDEQAVQTLAPTENYYIVMEGDTLAKISRSYYGTSSKIVEICEVNKISDPNNIIVGQKILLP